MNLYRVSFIGHREIHNIGKIEDRLTPLIRDLLRGKEYVEFYLGRNGDFDILAASAVKRAQKEIEDRNSSLILVLPYHVKDEEYYEKYYDEIMMPLEINTHFKAAITKRNQWMVDNSDLLIAYVKNGSGGAYNTVKYAKKRGVRVINIASETEE